MSAPISSSSLASQLNLRVSASATHAALFATASPAGPGSFSQTLQNRMEPPAPPPRPAPERPAQEAQSAAPAAREPEPTRPAAQEPSQGQDAPARNDSSSGSEGGTTRSGADGGRGAQDGQKSGEASADAPKPTSPEGPQEARAQAGTGDVDDAGAKAAAIDPLLAPGAAEAAALLAAAADGAAAANAPTDPAALAALPAAIAALLSGRQPNDAGTEATATDGERGAATLFEGGGRKALQDSALLPKDGKGAQFGGDARNLLAPGFILQSREAAAAMAATRAGATAPGLQALEAEAGNAGTTQANAGLHLHAPHTLVRPHASAAQATPQLPVNTPAGQQAWAEDVGNQVRWMLGRAESKAELVLTPPNLGKLEVSINLAGDQTTAQFIASSQAARDALERAMPQLREVLQQAGIMLGDANVSTSDRGAGGEERSSGQGSSGRGDTLAGTGGTTVEGGGSSVWLRQQQGMVDTFA